MIGVDVCGLNVNETLGVIRGRSKPLPEKPRNNVGNPGTEARESLQSLKNITANGGYTPDSCSNVKS